MLALPTGKDNKAEDYRLFYYLPISRRFHDDLLACGHDTRIR